MDKNKKLALMLGIEPMWMLQGGMLHDKYYFKTLEDAIEKKKNGNFIFMQNRKKFILILPEKQILQDFL